MNNVFLVGVEAIITLLKSRSSQRPEVFEDSELGEGGRGSSNGVNNSASVAPKAHKSKANIS